jgi:hypothetical protein
LGAKLNHERGPLVVEHSSVDRFASVKAYCVLLLLRRRLQDRKKFLDEQEEKKRKERSSIARISSRAG